MKKEGKVRSLDDVYRRCAERVANAHLLCPRASHMLVAVKYLVNPLGYIADVIGDYIVSM